MTQDPRKAKTQGLALLAPLQQAVTALRITNDDTYMKADAALSRVVQAREKWLAMNAEPLEDAAASVTAAKKAQASVTKLFNEVDKPMGLLETRVKELMAGYQLAKARQKRLAEAQAEALQREIDEKQARELAARTAPMRQKIALAREALEAKREEVAEVAQVKGESSQARFSKKIRVIAWGDFIQGLASGAIPDTVVEVDHAEFNRRFKEDPLAAAQWPGCEIYDEVVIARR